MERGDTKAVDIFGFVVALIAANWSALEIALKCRDKIDASRNLIWGISSGTAPNSTEMIDFIFKSDIIGFLFALVWILCGVGVILIFVWYYLKDRVPLIIATLYLVTGSLMVASGIGTGIVGWNDSKNVKRIAIERLSQYHLQK